MYRCLLAAALALTVFHFPQLAAEPYPQAHIGNALLTAEIYLPDAEKGYYRGTRFYWTGVIHSLKYKGHEFFGQWFEKHDPLIYDAITGPVNVSTTNSVDLGYPVAKPGENFIRIGVGLVEKPNETAYRGMSTYKVVDTGHWTVTQGDKWIDFVQDLPDKIGYAYSYCKRISLTPGKPEMVIGYSLKNTGSKVIDTTEFRRAVLVSWQGSASSPSPLKISGAFLRCAATRLFL